MSDPTPLQVLQQAERALWTLREHNHLHFGHNHSTVAEAQRAWIAVKDAIACLGAGLPAEAPEQKGKLSPDDVPDELRPAPISDAELRRRTLEITGKLIAAERASPAPAAAPTYYVCEREDAPLLAIKPDTYRQMPPIAQRYYKPVFASPLGGEPRIAHLTDEELLSALDSRGIACDPVLALEIKEAVLSHLAAPQSSRTSVEAPANAPSAEEPGVLHPTRPWPFGGPHGT